MKEPRFPSVRILLLMAVLALAGFAAGPAGAFAASAVETGGGVQAPAAADTGRIRMEGVLIRSSQWISVGETGFHPDQTLQPGGPVRKAPPPLGPEPARESERPSGNSPPPVPETRLNRIDMPLRLSEAGMLGGIGFGRIPEGRYEPILVAAHFGLNLGPFLHIPETHPGRLTLFAEPRFSPVREPAGDYEAGIGIGLQYAYPIFRNLFFYATLSTGPHAISVRTEQQARGFVFDSEAGGGFYVHLGRGSALNIGYRVRHLSNGGARVPNTGINNHLLVVGYSMFLDAPAEKERME